MAKCQQTVVHARPKQLVKNPFVPFWYVAHAAIGGPQNVGLCPVESAPPAPARANPKQNRHNYAGIGEQGLDAPAGTRVASGMGG